MSSGRTSGPLFSAFALAGCRGKQPLVEQSVTAKDVAPMSFAYGSLGDAGTR